MASLVYLLAPFPICTPHTSHQMLTHPPRPIMSLMKLFAYPFILHLLLHPLWPSVLCLLHTLMCSHMTSLNHAAPFICFLTLFLTHLAPLMPHFSLYAPSPAWIASHAHSCIAFLTLPYSHTHTTSPTKQDKLTCLYTWHLQLPAKFPTDFGYGKPVGNWLI